jgi:hypothetical protein
MRMVEGQANTRFVRGDLVMGRVTEYNALVCVHEKTHPAGVGTFVPCDNRDDD